MDDTMNQGQPQETEMQMLEKEEAAGTITEDGKARLAELRAQANAAPAETPEAPVAEGDQAAS